MTAFRFGPNPSNLEAALEQFNAIGAQRSTYGGPLVDLATGRANNLFVQTR